MSSHSHSSPPSSRESVGPSSPATSKTWWIGGGALVAISVAFAIVSATAKPEEAALVSKELPRLEDNAVYLPQKYQESAGVKVGVVKESNVTPNIRVIGNVDFDPTQLAAIGTRVPGLVRSVLKHEGDPVKRGDVLAEIESPDLAGVQADIMALVAERDASKINADREASLAERGLSTARESELAATNLKQAEAQLAAASQRARVLGGSNNPQKGGMGAYQLIAPLDGTVVEHKLHTGQAVGANELAFRVANVAKLWVALEVLSQNADKVALNDEVHLSPVANPNKILIGKIARIGEIVDSSTGTVELRLEVDNADHSLRAGEAVTATIATKASEGKAIMLQESAVCTIDGKATVFVSVGNERFLPRTITIGFKDAGTVAVTSGIKAGEKIITEGAFVLKGELFR